MRSFIKIILRVFTVAIIMAFAFAPAVVAEKMELATDAIKIYSIGQQTKGDTSFKIKGNTKMPDKVQITELSLTYEGKGKKASLLTIVEVGGDTLFSNNVTNGLIPDELKKSVRLYLSDDKSYIITHGDKTWNLNLNGTKPAQPETKDTLISSMAKDLAIPQWRIDEGFKIPEGANKEEISELLNIISKNIGENTKSCTPWWIYVIISILGLTCVYLLLPTLKVVLSKKNKKSISTQPEEVSGKNPSVPTGDTSVGTQNLSGNDDQIAYVETETTTLREKICSLLLDKDDYELSDDQKIAKIKILLESGQEAKDGMRLIRRALNIEDENIIPLVLSGKIEELKNSSSKLSQETYENIRAEICNLIIEKILSKKNKILSDIVADATIEKGENSYEIILKIINLLPFRIKDRETNPAIAEQKIAITDNQLSHIDNRYILKKWLKEQLNDADISGFDMNRTVRENLCLLSARLKESSKVSPRKTDEEIVTDVILEGNLTDGQKKVLIRKLIELINGQIADSSKFIKDSLSLNEFTQSVADALQQPNSHEEAQIQIQQRNIAILNEALDATLTNLSKDAIKDTMKKIIMGIVQSKLSNMSIDSYEDALKCLTICNRQSTDIEKLLQEFGAEKLVDLPVAIREKQYNDLIKSISDKVTELLPGQHFDSIQKLINILFKEIKDAKENRELIADELEERISLRDKQYTSVNGNRDILKLMSLYSDLVKAEDENLRKQINTKDAEIINLNDTISSQEGTINSLTNDNQILMSESSKLVEDLYGGAELILESCKTILNPCSDDEEAQCVDIEDRLFADLNSSVMRMRSFKAGSDMTPSNVRNLIQNLLVDEISSENSAVNTVCRYYAYSRLPFMTDTAREYGITFNRKNMSNLYNAIENLYVQFGINLYIPSLFVMGIEEGEFVNVTGQMYGDLDNLCQNSRNHFDNIDSATKPSNVIVDVVNVGYSVDGQVRRTTSVLTY